MEKSGKQEPDYLNNFSFKPNINISKQAKLIKQKGFDRDKEDRQLTKIAKIIDSKRSNVEIEQILQTFGMMNMDEQVVESSSESSF